MVEIRLSEPQKNVVAFGDGALLVVAGPGSGKTRVLTERVRRLVTEVKGHFRVLALTFTNKAANEMRERLKDLPDLTAKASIATLHGFCLELLTDRGKPLGVSTNAQIFESYADRKQILIGAVASDPEIAEELASLDDEKARARRLDEWLRGISFAKAHPVTRPDQGELFERLIQAYDSGLRACGAYDFDDLLLLSYQLLTEYPAVASFYRRLYRYICIDEAQDLNEAQYQVLKALCGDEYRNVMMVGDPKQSIYGFNTSSPIYMDQFAADFSAEKVELTENYRSSRAVVAAAQALLPQYTISGQLPIAGLLKGIVGVDEADEAKRVVDTLKNLLEIGHPDVEGEITCSKCAILGRSRFLLLGVEAALADAGIPYVKRLTTTHENSSALVREFFLGLRVIGNPRDILHLSALAKTWRVNLLPATEKIVANDAVSLLRHMAQAAKPKYAAAVVAALAEVIKIPDRIAIKPAVAVLQRAADSLDVEERQSVYEDTAVLAREWDQYLRLGGRNDSLSGFMSAMALGTTQHAQHDGVALLTVHSSKGLEFDVVFVMGLADGSFPDYRARGKQREEAEELRNAFVAVTRSKRLLYLSYPQKKMMPWGDVRDQAPSPFYIAIKNSKKSLG